MITPTEVVRNVARHYGVELEDVRGPSRSPTAVKARRLAIYVLRLRRSLTWGEIARAVGIERSAARRHYLEARENPDPASVLFMSGQSEEP